jgi:O-antigen/teichoic acid export membrane protein
LTIVTIAVAFARLGLDYLLLRSIARFAQDEDWGRIRGLCGQSSRIALFAATSCSILIFFSAEWIGTSLLSKPAIVEPLRIMTLAVPPMSLLLLYGEMLKGLQKIEAATFVQLVGTPLIGGLSCTAMVLVFRTLSLNLAAVVYVLSSIIVALISISLWELSIPKVKSIKTDSNRVLLKRTAPFLGISLINLALNSLDVLMLGLWSDAQSVAIYGVATRMASLTTFFLSGVNVVVAPKFSILYEKGQYDELAQLSCQSSRLSIALTLPFLLPLLVFPRFFLSLFGHEYVEGAIILVILVLGQVVNVLTGAVGYLLMMTGNEKALQFNLIFITIFNILMNVILIPKFGIVGAAMSGALSLAVMNLINSAIVYRQLSILVSPFYSRNTR